MVERTHLGGGDSNNASTVRHAAGTRWKDKSGIKGICAHGGTTRSLSMKRRVQ